MKLSIWFFMDSVPFDEAVISGHASLGGSESACKGTAEALSALGHDVKMFATRLDATRTHKGVTWLHARELSEVLKFAPPDVFCSLRTTQPFMMQIPAALNILWNQDLMIKPHDAGILAGLSQVDKLVFVSEFHKAQWCGLHPFLESMAYVTRNGIFAEAIPRKLSTHHNRPERLIYMSRPERGLAPLLEMWPRMREQRPNLTLAIARYRSMYDGEGSNVAQMCASFDEQTAAVHAAVGGIEILGALGKRELYREIGKSALMVYPGVENFAETGCIAAAEAQACGTPLVASWKGAIPETLHQDAGVLIEGDAHSEAYQDAFVDTVDRLLRNPDQRDEMARAGSRWARDYRFDVIAKEWDAWLHETFEQRYDSNRAGVMRQLLHWDQHAAAQIVADSIVDDVSSAPVDIADAKAAKDLCGRVIRQEEHTAEGYARHAVNDVEREMQQNRRLRVVAEAIAELKPARVLDVSCGNGTLACLVAQACPDAEIDGFDFSEGVIGIAQANVEKLGVADRVRFAVSDYRDIPESEPYDVVFCGEFLEHVEKPWELLDLLETYCAPDGQVLLTTPCGPFAELLTFGMEHQRGHVHAFSVRDIATMCRHKKNYRWRYLGEGVTQRHSAVGYWFVRYEPGGGAAQPLDYDHTILTTRPYQRVMASMIVKNGADWLRKCLKSLHGVVDGIVVLDTGSTDGSQEIARELGAEVHETEWPNSFAAARNQALDLVQDRAEWVLWIDSDEQLMNSIQLRRFVTGAGPYNAYVLRQVHLAIDRDTHDDKPQRIFRTGQGVRFYGDVHEQPEQLPDEGIQPALDLSDPAAPRIMHWGYYDEATRRDKLQHRNLPLLNNELRSEHPRELAYVLAIRDHCNLAMFAREEAGGQLTDFARTHYERAIAMFQERFLDVRHKYFQLAWPYYQSALQGLNRGVTAKWGFAATLGSTMRGDVRTEQIWAASADELNDLVSAQVDLWCEPLREFVPRTEPVQDHANGWSLPGVGPVEATGCP